MRISKKQLRTLIKEELTKIISEIDVSGEEYGSAVSSTFDDLPQGTMGAYTDEEMEEEMLNQILSLDTELKQYGLSAEEAREAFYMSGNVEEILTGMIQVYNADMTRPRSKGGYSSLSQKQRAAEYLIDELNLISRSGRMLMDLTPELVRDNPRAKVLNRVGQEVMRLVGQNRREIKSGADFERVFIKYANQVASGG
tara:strand:- start:89 stop:679 length:591 start_codon:yes stop_codon:yes gene_type:complete